MSKYLLIFIFGGMLYCVGFSQNIDTTSLTIKGGYTTFVKSIYVELPGLDSFEIYNYSKENRSYAVQFHVKKDGSIGNEIFVCGLKDSLLTSRIVRGIMKTQGLWSNHTGSDAVAVVNVYYVFVKEIKDEMSIYADEPNLVSSYYRNGNKQKYVFLKPIIVQAGATMR